MANEENIKLQKLESQKQELVSEITKFIGIHRQRHGVNFWAHYGLAALGVAGTISIGIAGILGETILAAIIAAISNGFFALDSLGAIGERAEFQRIIARKAENLILELRYATNSEKEFQAILRSFFSLGREC